MVRIGVVGLGMMGVTHLHAYRKLPNARLVAICDADPKRAGGDFSDAWSNMAAKGGSSGLEGVRGVARLEDLLSMPEVDVVDICLPTPFHLDACLGALASGKHVLCEKPLARTSADAQKIADAAAMATGFFMPAMCMRFWPQWVWLKEAIDDKRFGRVITATFHRMAKVPPGWYSDGKKSGGAILDLHVHDSDFIFHIWGMPHSVSSKGQTVASGCIDQVETRYIYEGSEKPTEITAVGGWSTREDFAFRMSYTVRFERAIVSHDTAANPTFSLTRDGKTEGILLEGDGYLGELAYFLRCVEKGTPPARVTAADAVASLRILEAEQKSVETGKIVVL